MSSWGTKDEEYDMEEDSDVGFDDEESKAVEKTKVKRKREKGEKRVSTSSSSKDAEVEIELTGYSDFSDLIMKPNHEKKPLWVSKNVLSCFPVLTFFFPQL